MLGDAAPPETKFGKYTLVRRIAVGGMAEIYLARQEGMAGFAREVAIKRVHEHLNNDPEFINMFLDEARLVAKLSHPNIVSVHEFGQEGNFYYLVMEFVDGQPLSAAIKRTGGVEPIHTLRVISEICAGLNYAHSLKDDTGEILGIVHRDVSPQNVLIGYDGAVKLIDFGVAKTTSQSHRTKPGSFKGKYAYMSPEQARGKSADQRSDVHAVGIVMWESLTGRSLYFRDSVFHTMEAVLKMGPPSVRSKRPELADELDGIIGKAMAKNPVDRFQSCSEMQIAVDELMADHGLHSNSLTLGRWAQRLFSRDSHPPGALAKPLEPSEEFVDVEILEDLEELDELDSIDLTPSPSEHRVSEPPSPHHVAMGSSAPLDEDSLEKVITTPKQRPALDAVETDPNSSPGLEKAITTPKGRAAPKESQTPIPPTPVEKARTDPMMESPIHKAPTNPILKGIAEMASASPMPIDLEGENLRTRRLVDASPIPESIPVGPKGPGASIEPRGSSSPAIALPESERSISQIPRGPGASIEPPGSSSPAIALPESEQSISQVPRRKRRGPLVWVLTAVVVSIVGGVGVATMLAVEVDSPSGGLARPTDPAGGVATESGLVGGDETDATGDAGEQDMAATHPIGLPNDDAGVDEGSAEGAVEVEDTSVDLPTAFLTIHSEPPGARVFIDGRNTGERTSVRDLPLDPGGHAVELSLDGYRIWRRNVDAERGQLLRVRAVLRSAPAEQGADARAAEAGPPVDYGLLSVDTRPSSVVFHGRRELGSTPLAGVELPAGAYSLVFRIDDGRRFEQTVTIRPGRTTRRQFVLVPEDDEEPVDDGSQEPGVAPQSSPEGSSRSSTGARNSATTKASQGGGSDR